MRGPELRCVLCGQHPSAIRGQHFAKLAVTDSPERRIGLSRHVWLVAIIVNEAIPTQGRVTSTQLQLDILDERQCARSVGTAVQRGECKWRYDPCKQRWCGGPR